MEIQFHGSNCLTITTKQARVVVDDDLEDLGAKTVGKSNDISLFTGLHAGPKPAVKIVIDQPGEYEVSGVSIYGIAARAYMDEAGKQNATLYKLLIDDLRVLITGHIYPELTDDELESIGVVDFMIVPVGGNGYTLDGVDALKLVKKIEPKKIIPTHYQAKGLNFPVPQDTLEQALKGLAMEPKETLKSLKIKSVDVADDMQLIVLERI